MLHICKLTHTGHWIFVPAIQYIIEWKTIIFSFRNLHEASEELQQYARCTGKTVLSDHCTVTPRNGEVILSMFKHPRAKQLSIHPRFLILWELVQGSEVMVLIGTWFRIVGSIKDQRDDGQWVLKFAIDKLTDHVFNGKDLAGLE